MPASPGCAAGLGKWGVVDRRGRWYRQDFSECSEHVRTQVATARVRMGETGAGLLACAADLGKSGVVDCRGRWYREDFRSGTGVGA
jgi:hypothetical protein